MSLCEWEQLESHSEGGAWAGCLPLLVEVEVDIGGGGWDG